MPTYEDLRSYFEESGELREVSRAAAGIRIVTGFTLNVHPLWPLLYDLEDDLISWPRELPGGPEQWLEYFYRPFGWGDAITNMLQPVSFCNRTSYQGYRRRDLYRSIRMWSKLASRYGVSPWPPVILTIVHRPLRPPVVDKADEVDDQQELRRLVAVVNASRAPVRIEERPRARLALSTGGAIQTSNSKSGTLGGVLDDWVTGKSYGVTCAHVAARGDTITDISGAVIGRCTADTRRSVLPAQAVCDPVNLAVPAPSPGNGPDVNMLDCALVELSAPVSRSTVAGVAARISPGQDVTLTGASTHTTHHKLGSLCLSYSFVEGGNDYCFRDAVELLPQPWGPFGGTLGQMMTTIPTQGDSGGWVLTGDNPPYWAGLFFGEDGHRGFVIRASWAHNWAKGVVGSNLVT